MHIRIAYYSGSGNTQYVALLLRKFLSARYDVSTFFIKKNKRMDNNFDALILGMPVYAYMPPLTVMDFLNTLVGEKRPVFIFITKGLISGNAGRVASFLLRKRGFIIKGVRDILMADSLFILLAKEDSILQKIMLLPNMNIEKRVQKFALYVEKKLFVEDKERIPRTKFYVPITYFIAKIFWKKEREWQTKFFADERCDTCGACVGLCPTNNIAIRDGIVLWGEDCDFCLRCLHRCPKRAIQIGRYTKKSIRYRGPSL